MKERLDDFDRQILMLLQEDGGVGPSELSGRIGLSASQCSRRLQRLREDGVIERTVAILDRESANLGVSAFILVRLKSQSVDAEAIFRAKVMALPEIMSCDYVAGDFDFVLKILTKDMDSYSAFVADKLRGDEVDSMRSMMIMKPFKDSTAIPLSFM